MRPLRAVLLLIITAVVLYAMLRSTYNFHIVKRQCTCRCEPNENRSLSLEEESASAGEADVTRQSKNKVLLLVVVLTGPNNVKPRNALRSTWLSNGLNNRVYDKRFVIGTADLEKEAKELLQKEQNLNGDMVLLEDCNDSHKTLASKLLKSFVWIREHVDCSFVMKADDDTFANLNVILHELNTKYHAVDNLYWGFHTGNSRIWPTGPWAEPRWIFCDLYLPYAYGGGYILSYKLVEYVANISALVEVYNNEDVALGIWLSPVGVTRVHDVRFDTEELSRGCRNAHIVSHKQSIQDMHDKFTMLQHHKHLCSKEEYLMKSYIYDWTVPPSRCCQRKNGIP